MSRTSDQQKISELEQKVLQLEEEIREFSLKAQEYSQTEAAFQERNEKQRLLFDSMGAGIAYYDTQGKVELINKIGANNLGGEPKDFIDLHLEEFLEKETAELLRERLEAVIKSGQSAEYSDYMDLPPGGMHLQSIFHPVSDSSGAIIGVQIISVDITERKQVETALQAEFQRNEQILNTMLDGFILADTEGQLVSVNPAYCALVGYSEPELLQKNIRELEVKLLPEEVERRIEQMVSQGSDRFETQHQHKDGRVIDLDVSIVIMQIEEAPLVAAFVRDITARKQAEDDLKMSENRFRLMTENAPDYIFTKNKERKYTFVNQAMQELFGIPEDEILGKTPEEIFGPEQGSIVREVDDRTFAGETVNETRSLQIGDEQLYFNTIQSPLLTEDREVVSIVGIVRDITERVRAEQDLLKNQQQLELIFNTTTNSMALIRVDDNGEFFMASFNNTYWEIARNLNENISRQDLMGISIRRLGELFGWSKQATQVLLENYQMAIAMKKPLIQNESFATPNLVVHLRSTYTPVFDIENNKCTHILFSSHDITEQVQSREALHLRAQELTSLNAVNSQINRSLSVDSVSKQAVHGVLEATQASVVFLLMREGDDLIPTKIVFSDSDREFADFPVHKLGTCLCELGVTERKPIFFADISRDERCDWKEFKDEGLKSAAALPLYRRDEVFAVLGLGGDSGRNFETQAEFLETLASGIATGLLNAMLHEQLEEHAAHLEERVDERTKKLQIMVNAMAGREVRMAELKRVIKQLRAQIVDAGMSPVADDPLLGEIPFREDG